MNIEQQVISRELAKKMDELGFSHESLFWWCRWASRDVEYTVEYIEEHDDFVVKTGGSDERYPAYTVAELGEMLPRGIATRKGWGLNNGYVMFDNEANEILSDKKEADSRAEMLIYLAENNLINPKDITL